MTSAAPVSVLVVDDSAVVRRLIVDALGGDPGIRVAGIASNGRLALAKIDELRPDIVTMDIEMPEMDGITAVRELRRRRHQMPVIMFSTLSAAGASATLDALAAGATDYITKPSNVGGIAASVAAVREQLLPRIHQLGARRPSGVDRPPALGERRSLDRRGSRGLDPDRGGPDRAGPAGAGLGRAGPAGAGLGRAGPAGARLVRAGPVGADPVRGGSVGGGSRPAGAPPSGRPRGARVDIVAVGCSTGGPAALTRLLQALPPDLPVPVVVTQHMPPVFTRMFAERLNRGTPLTVLEAAADLPLEPGTVYLAAGDRHLVLQRERASLVIRLSAAPPENSCRPAVDVMFRSVAAAFGASALGVVLTGMGYDGREGSRELVAAGGAVLAQDEASSVVWGMPRSVAGAGLAEAVLSLDEIGPSVVARVGAGRVARSAAVGR